MQLSGDGIFAPPGDRPAGLAIVTKVAGRLSRHFPIAPIAGIR
jgi:hypothetical protein